MGLASSRMVDELVTVWLVGSPPPMSLVRKLSQLYSKVIVTRTGSPALLVPLGKLMQT